MPVSPIASAQTFANRSSAVQNLRLNPSVQAHLAKTPGQQAGTDKPLISARQQALQERANGINSWGRDMTALKQQGKFQKDLAKLQTESAAAAKAAEQTRVSIPQGQQRQQQSSGPRNNVNLPAASGSGVRAQIVSNAQKMIGTPYAWGGGGIGNRASRGTGKGTQNVVGVDCSGLTSYVYGLVGLKLPRQSDRQLATGVKTNISNAQPGDLVGWGPGGHVAVYAGNGMIIEAPKPGGFAQARKLSASDNRRGVYAVRLRLPGE